MSKSGKRNKATRPFMPLHGGRAVPHRTSRHDGGGEAGGADDGKREKKDTVMQVGADAMIDESEANADAAPHTPMNGGGDETNGAGGIDDAGGGEPISAGRRHVNLEAAFGLPKEDLPVEERSEPEPAATPGGRELGLEELKAERDSYLDMARRERADFDNYRKRVEREMRQMKRESLASFLKEFFGPLDDLDRVMQESQKNHSFESLVQGVRIMEENFWRTLAKAGVKRIDAKGKPFDPNLHEAMTTMPSADVPPNTVLEVFENGYKLDDFILRPARVVVSRAPDA